MMDERQPSEHGMDVPEPLLREQQLAAVGQLTADFAHNLNNLITSILGNLALARSAVARGESPENAFAGIQEAAKNAGDASRSLLTFARGSEGDWRPVELDALAERAMTLLRLPHGIRFERSDRPSDPVFVQGDPALLELALVNLVLLARGMLARGGKLGLAVQADPGPIDGQAATARVVHTVSGHAASRIARLLEIDDPTSAAAQSGGLELLVARAIARQHGGHVELVSRGDAEVQIELRLPRLEVEEHIARFSAPEPSQLVGQGRRVLLVEPQRHIGELVQSALGHVGFKVDTVRSLAEAKALLIESHRIDAVVIDVEPDDPSWVERMCEQRPGMALVMVARDPELSAQQLATNLGGESISVPFRMFELADAVDRAIARRAVEKRS